jgi:hypothetical protein
MAERHGNTAVDLVGCRETGAPALLVKIDAHDSSTSLAAVNDEPP